MKTSPSAHQQTSCIPQHEGRPCVGLVADCLKRFSKHRAAFSSHLAIVESPHPENLNIFVYISSG
ncbi:hypothetical protein BDV36DRAFT_251308 [Aspergillus pseudocaelatus]|uniref:Uncharacterized protein n=1 Tax=Aspergillus pseudocaelatus TaxID=1825620 RepID=A0ABQ6WR53_9EURO|nr:hypothetical protein BDV36DRAFT_251308 [Aspergillus pseudocaelatus]